ncbi:hypothetical protein F5148DRAFT_1370102 [Russula earlei]|uniref:Uncharacterized protein n=1 Tax=Russula earlei TaxID=71964 RepID=A0ACC0TYX7_9AGAM|nr:hypothetical protein F5148DRAFT_1370102 [Russula earlei]
MVAEGFQGASAATYPFRGQLIVLDARSIEPWVVWVGIAGAHKNSQDWGVQGDRGVAQVGIHLTALLVDQAMWGGACAQAYHAVSCGQEKLPAPRPPTSTTTKPDVLSPRLAPLSTGIPATRDQVVMWDRISRNVHHGDDSAREKGARGYDGGNGGGGNGYFLPVCPMQKLSIRVPLWEPRHENVFISVPGDDKDDMRLLELEEEGGEKKSVSRDCVVRMHFYRGWETRIIME